VEKDLCHRLFLRISIETFERILHERNLCVLDPSMNRVDNEHESKRVATMLQDRWRHSTR
jgi:hypothetical protein